MDLRDALNGGAGSLGGEGVLLQLVGGRLGAWVGHLKRGQIPVLRQLIGICQPGIRVFGCFFGHGDGAFCHGGQRLGAGIRRGNLRLSLPDKNPKPDVDPF